MKQPIVELRGVEGKTMYEMAIAPMPISPRLVFWGTDSSGRERNAEITLDNFLTLPTRVLRVEYMAKTGLATASYPPYITHLEEVHVLQKKVVDLRKAEYGKEESIIVISGVHIPKEQHGTRSYIMLAHNQETIGFNLVDPTYIDLGRAHTHIYEEIQTFIDCYSHRATKSKQVRSTH